MICLRLRQLRDEDVEYGYGDFIDLIDSDDADLQALITTCRKTQPEEIVRRYGQHYSSQKAFLDKADTTLRKYVAQQVERLLVQAVQQAARLGIHIFFAPKPGTYPKKKDELHYNSQPLSLHAAFTKRDDGIDYRLTLGHGLVPSLHQTRVLCNQPSLIVTDHELRQLDDGLGGKLLSPFLKTEVYHIPAAMQETYFRKFILKIVRQIDITAEGFAVDNRHPQGRMELVLEQTIGGDYGLTPSMVYDKVAFGPDDTREKNVTLHDDGKSVSFVCVWRDKEWEQTQLELLSRDLQLPQPAPLPDITAWVSGHDRELRQLGIGIRQYTSRHYVLGNVTIKQEETCSVDWFQLHITLLFPDGTSMRLTDLAPAIINGDSEVQLPSGNWFVIPTEWFARYSALMLFGLHRKDGSIMVHRSQRAILPASTDAADTAPQPARPQIGESLSLPRLFRATLRPYQEEGYRWMLGHLYGGTGCCLSDDMGLGKTVQAMAVMEKYFEGKTRPRVQQRPQVIQLSLFGDEETGTQPAAIQARTGGEPGRSGSDGSAATAWRPALVVAPSSVVFNWADELKRFAPDLEVTEYTGTTRDRAQLQPKLEQTQVVLTSYTVLRNDIDALARVRFSIAVYDEAHTFRNSNSQLFQAICRVEAQHSIALTGTPITNELDDLWSLMGVLNPSLLGGREEFQHNFIHPINQNIGSAHTRTLRKLVAPFFLRRLRSQVLDSLPERQDETVWCDMTPQQSQLYEKEQSSMRNLLMDPEKASNTVIVLSALTRLRQIASSPALVGQQEPSGKIDEVVSRLEQLRDSDHKVLLFSEFTSLLDLVAHEMDSRGWTYDMLTGKSRNRKDIVKHFQETPSCQFFLVSLKAGGEGLNLTQADYVFLLDPWWNSAAEEQAISRAHRSGQKRSVMVYRFISKGTVEEQILKVQDRKQSLIDAVMSHKDLI